jgi:hypothetical protein
MPFIGQQPLTGAYSKLDSITTSATATYNLQLGGSAYSPASANHLLVSLNGVMQAPQDSFTVSGSTITFASALTSSDNIDFIMAMGDVLNIGTPSDGTVTAGKIASGAVTSAKIGASQVTDAKIASGISSSKLTGALPALDGSALTGTTPAIVAGDVVQQVHTSVQNYPHPSNTGGHIASDGNGAITETTAYSSGSLTPLIQLGITKKITNSKLIVNLTGRFNISTGYRSQIALYDSYTSGQAQNTDNSIGYHHYGLYNNTGGDYYNPGSYEYAITGLSAGATKTYYWFGGSIGVGTQKYWGLTMTITEIAT